MADNRQGWRQQPGKPTGPSPGPGTGKHGWQKQAAAPAGPRKPMSRGFKLFLAAAAVGVIIGGIVVAIQWLIPIRPAGIVLVGASYDDNLAIPHNVHGWNTLSAIEALRDEPIFSESGRPDIVHRSPELKGADAWKKEWDLFKGNIRQKTAVFYFALHGAADGKDPYFFVNDDAGYARLPLAEVLKSFESLGEDRNLLLIVEPALARSNWSAGVLDNDFVARLKEVSLKPNVFILCASDAYQTSWASEEWRMTDFGHFVVEGLRGKAAPIDRVTVADLFRYVKDRVVHWSQTHHGVEQTPILLGDLNRAGAAEIAQVAAAPKPASETPTENFDIEPVRAAWNGWHALDGQVPHPSTYSPALWRRYQDMLVRHEQLVRAGASAKSVDDVRNKLESMRRGLAADAKFDDVAGLAPMALPMFETLGIRMPAKLAQGVERQVQAIWDAPDAEQRDARIKQFLEASRQDGATDAQASVALYAGLLDHLIEKPIVPADVVSADPDAFSRTQTILDKFDQKLGRPRPAEIHYLTMLLKDAPRDPAPNLDLIRQALKTRRLAERTALASPPASKNEANDHPYGEALSPWIAPRLAASDAHRRPGEDLLFAAGKLDWSRAGDFLKQAEILYLQAQKDAAAYRRALELRDRAFAELPYFALWSSRLRVGSGPGGSNPRDDHESVEMVERLSRNAESLQAELSKPTPSPAALDQLAGDLDRVRRELRVSMAKQIDALSRDQQAPEHWVDRESILAVPPLVVEGLGSHPVETRLHLIEENRRTSRALFDKKDAPAIAGGDPRKDAETLARRNRVLALAAVKPFWPREFAPVDLEDSAAVSRTLGDQMKRWSPQLHDDLARGLKAPDLAEAKSIFERADVLARGLPGGFEEPTKPATVSRNLRSLRMHDLLVSQAKRTRMDHWFAEDGQPFYKPAAIKYLNSARGLAEANAAPVSQKYRAAAAQSLIDALDRPQESQELTVDNQTAPFWTSEKEFAARWVVKTPDDPYIFDPKRPEDADVPPSAIATTWRELSGPAEWKDADRAGVRAPLDLRTNRQRDFAQTFFLSKPSTGDGSLKASFHVLLRGQRIASRSEIHQKEPDLIVHGFPLPPKAMLKVRMHPDFNYGAISIGLDISGSMIWRKDFGVDTPQGRKTRLELALRALRPTLERIPENTYVSVFAFATIKPKQDAEVHTILPPTLWKRARTDEVLQRIDLLEASAWAENEAGKQGGTIIADMLAECAERGFPSANVGFRGPKVILALTDGCDTTSKMEAGSRRPTQEQQNSAVADFVTRKFKSGDIMLQVVCFLDPKQFKTEADHATAQFSHIDKSPFPDENRFTIQPDPSKLAEDLDRAIRPRLVLRPNPVRFDVDGEPASLPNDPDYWHVLPPKDYEILVKGSPARLLRLGRGDMIALVLKRDPADPRKVVYERELFSDLRKDVAPLLASGTIADDRLRVAVLQNEPQEIGSKLRQLVAVEELPNVSGEIRQKVPNFVWIESDPTKSPPPRLLRWHREFGYPALTYRTLGYQWPFAGTAPIAPQVRVWATDNVNNPQYARVLERPLKKTGVDDVRCDDQFARIEAVTIEERSVAGDRFNYAPVSKQCLVVRVEHGKGQPVFIQHLGRPGGEEHHYFPQANKSTALFYDLPESNPEKAAFNVIFLDAFKKETTPATFTINHRNANFPPPDPRIE